MSTDAKPLTRWFLDRPHQSRMVPNGYRVRVKRDDGQWTDWHEAGTWEEAARLCREEDR